ncbi:TPA: transcriptional repressor [Candidatus Poribacteria bacterium]|nr:transcriptional repressor [Candidatus Poribacteria bacterium]
MKFTKERRIILESAFATHRHFEVDDLLFQLRSNNKRVSKATIYRTLPLLVRSGLLREVHDDDKHTHYEHIYGHEHHDHLICLNCGKIIEFGNPIIESLQDEVCKQHEFTPVKHRYEILGYCRECVGKGHP